MANENRRKLYNAINQAGYDIGDYDEFDKRMNNAADRQKFFQAVNDAGYDIGSQEEFERRISPSKYKLKTGGKYIPVGEREYKDFVSRKSGSQKPSQPSNFQQTIDNALGTVSQARQTVNRIGNKEKQIGLNVPKSDFGRVDIGKNRKVTTKGNRYVTEAGNEYENRAMADVEQYAIEDAKRRELDPIGTELEDAYAERDRIDNLLKSRIEEIEKERSREGFLSGMLREAGAASRSDMLPDATSLSMDLESDREYSSLMAAARKNKELITTLEDQRDKKTNDFWHSLGTEITNGYTFSLGGKAKMDDITSLMEARKHLDTINQKRSRGESLTHDEEVAETVLKNNEWDRQIQAQYGDDYGAWARAGKMGANSADFMLDFLMMGGAPMNVARGVMNAIVKGGENMIGNAVAKGFGRFMLKSTGATLGSMVAGAQITNTIQLGKTGSDIAQSMIGDVYQDAQGNFVFGHYEEDENGNPRFVKGGNSFLTALADAERAGISENGSEVLGTFLPGAGKVFQDLGLSKIARGITALKGKGWYQNYSKFLQTAGFNGVAGEGLEEYGGMVLDALMGGDEWKKIADPRTHLDIWLGVSTMAGMLNAPNVIGTGYSALQYQRYKKATNLADVEASSVIPSGTWDALRETIDATDNTTMADVAMDILSNEELTSEGKRAAMDYIDKLQKMRGYSLGSIASGKPQDDEEEPIDDESRDLDEGYTEGYDTQDADMMKQFSDEAQSAEELLPSYGSKFAEMVISGDAVQTMDYLMRNRNIFTDEQIEAAADYYQKKSREDGMLDGVMDRVDLMVATADAQVMSETHRASKQRIIATSGENVYYITAGEVGTDPETGNVILIGTGGAVVGRDISTGATEVLNPSNVQLYSVEKVDDLINYNHTTLREKFMQQADDDITYGSPAQEVFEQEDTVTLNDGEGGVIEGQIGMLPNSVDGVYVVYTNDGRALQLTEDDLNRRIVAHNGVEVVRGSASQEQVDNTETAENYAQNAPENIRDDNSEAINENEDSGILDNAGGEASRDQAGANEPPATALSRIPVRLDENGQPVINRRGTPVLDYHKASLEDATDALLETTGGDMVMARDNAAILARNAEEKLMKLRKRRPKGEDPEELAYSSMQLKREIEEQQAIIKQWKDVATSIQKRMEKETAERRAAEEAAKSEEQRRIEAEEARVLKQQQDEAARKRLEEEIEKDRKRREKPYEPMVKARQEMAGDTDALSILDDTEPRSLEEYVSSSLRPHSILWLDTNNNERGLKSELGLNRSDMQRFMHLLGTKDSGAKSFDSVVVDIHQALPEGIKEQFTDADVRNVLLELFRSSENSTKMMNLTAENRIEEAREMMRENDRMAAEYEMLAWAEAYHLNPDEREDWEEFMSIPPTPIEQDVINQIIEEQYEQQNQGNGSLDQQSIIGTDTAGVEGGETEVRQETQATGGNNSPTEPEQAAEASTGEPPVAGNTVDGGVIPVPEVDMPRMQALRESLAEAYQSGEPGAIANAAKGIQDYVDEGLDDYSEFDDSIDEYDGNEPEKLADKYIARVFHDRYLDDDADQEYIITGLAANNPSTPIGATSSPEQITEQEGKVNTEPTDGQKEAGNYQKGHIKVDGYDITIENPKGSVRSGVDSKGNRWETPMNNTYGYIRGTEGVDGDHIDVFISENPASGSVFVVDQVNPSTGEFDEHKVMYGFASEEEARQAYLSNYSKDWKGLGNITEVTRDEFKKWVESSHRKTKPFADYKSVKKAAAVPQHTEQPAEQPKRLVSDDRMEELKKRLRSKLGGQLNVGVDPEILAIGAEMAVGYIERGVTKFADYARTMIEEVGDFMRPYLKSFYNAVRDMPEAQEYAGEMDDYQTVSSFDVFNFDKQKRPTLMEKAEQVVKEQKVIRQARDISEEKKRLDEAKKVWENLCNPKKISNFADDKGKQAEWVDAHLDEIVDAYINANGNKLDPDEFRRCFAAIGYDGKNVPDFREQEKRCVAEIYDRMLKKAVENGNASITLLTGVGGAGKSTATRNMDLGSRGVVYDSAFNRFEKLSDAIEHAKAAGMTDVQVIAVHNDALTAYSNVVNRGLATGRFISLKDFDGMYRENAKKIADLKEKHPDITITCYDNSGNKGNERPEGGRVSADEAAGWNYEIDIPLLNQLLDVLEDGINEGRFTEDQATSLGRGLRDLKRRGTEDEWRRVEERIERIERGIRGQADRMLRQEFSTQPGVNRGHGMDSTGNEGVQGLSSDSRLSDRGGSGEPRGVAQESPQQLDLFGNPIVSKQTKEKKGKDNGLLRDDEGVRSEGLPADRADGGGNVPGESETPGQESGGSDRSGETGSVGGSRQRLLDGLRSGDELNDQEKDRKNLNNNHAERGKDYAPKGVDDRIEANIAAIELMQKLMDDGRKATKKEMAVLRKFSGWGGLGKAFNTSDWRNDTPSRLKQLLGDEAYAQAEMSRNSAYFTPAKVIDALWDIARALGFKGGKVLEGSAGIGNILGLMPADMSERSDIQAVEIDQTTGNILSLLYPDAQVDIQGFEQTRVQNGSVDLAITNVPFVTGLHVIDESGDKDLSRKFRDIHDFCIAKNVRKLKPGGIGIFITSSGTLDRSQKLRDWLIGEGGADVVGAFRLNNTTFGGTAVTSDIIVVRKRIDGQRSANAIDVSTVTGERTATTTVKETDKSGWRTVDVKKTLTMDYNRYFMEHPEMMGGEMKFGFEKGDTYRPTSRGCYPVRGENQEGRLKSFVEDLAGKEWEKTAEPSSDTTDTVYDKLGEGVKEGSMLIDGSGRLCVATYGEAVPLDVNSSKVKGHTKQECFKSYSAVKDAVRAVLDYQTEHEEDTGLKPLLDTLNKVFDDFVNTYGHFYKNPVISFLKNDMDFSSIAALENAKERNDENGKRVIEYTKSDIFKKRVVEKETEPKPQTVKDGVITSIYKFGGINIGWMVSTMPQFTEQELRKEIVKQGLGFEDPLSREMIVTYEYLSGNVREKLRQAMEAMESGNYEANVRALEKVIPMNIPAHLIEFTIGSSWVEPKLFEDYIKERTGIDVKLSNVGGTWIVNAPKYGLDTEKNRELGVRSQICDKIVYGHELIAAAIQNRTVSVKKTTTDRLTKKSETITDQAATALCQSKIDEIRQDFKDWAKQKMQSDAELSERMEKEYNERFNNFVPKTIPDVFVPEHFGGAATTVKGRPFKLEQHQAKAAIRATTQNVMLAHEVGAGKTYTLITTAMEMRRLGTARKPMIVVQNATVGQFVRSAKNLYPNAKILTLEDADRTKEGRKAFYAKIKYNDWDMVVIPQSVLEMIPDSEERQMAYVQSKIEEKMMVLEQMRDAGADDQILKQNEREVETLREDLAVLKQRSAENNSSSDGKEKAKARQNAAVKAKEMLDRKVDAVENFDQMGIDALLVDEAHEYKHLGFATAMQRGVKGVDPSYSKKAQGVFLKCQSVKEKTGGKNVVFATGTPISNTAAEIWTFMRYLMPEDQMKEYGIYYFDDFVRNFGNLTQMLEFQASGKFKENNRFAGYVNLPELVRIWSGVADTVTSKEIEENRQKAGKESKLPEIEGGKAQDIYLPQSRALRSVMKYVKEELDKYDKMSGRAKKENSHIPLTMYGIAKAAAVDARLVVDDAEDDPNSKTNEAVRQTLKSLDETKDYNGIVAIFSDMYQNKHSGFNLYEDIRKKLIEKGVPAEQIVVMKGGMSVNKKLEIFDKCKAGEVRVILGSTFTLGTGVNIQERLHTLIHLDAPVRPMDYTQRNGRIVRQGNLHKQWGKPVRILRMGVEDSLDVTAYQRLKTKGAIADSIMNGKQFLTNSMENRVMEEEEDVFGDTVAQLSGSEYALLKQQAEREVRKLEAKQKQWEYDQTFIHNQKPRLRGLISESKKSIERADQALATIEEKAKAGQGITVGKMKFASIDAMGDFIKEQNKKTKEIEDRIRKSYRDEYSTSKLTVNAGGIDFVLTTELSKETERKGGSLVTVVKRRMTYSCEELGLNDVPVKQGLLRNALEDITQNVITGNDFRERKELEQRSIDRYEQELKNLDARDGKPFEFADELEKARERYAEYEEKMKKELEAKEAKYAEMDANVDSASPVEASEEEEDDVLNRADEDVEGPEADDELTELDVDSVEDMARALHLDGRLEILTTTDGLKGKKARSKGWFNPKTGKIVIVLPNNISQDDVVKTLLHEGVAHYGLRNMFGENFDEFLDNVYERVDPEIRSRIDAAMKRNSWGRHEATEEYLARLAERTDFDNAVERGWWQKIKDFFMDMMEKIGLHVTLSDNDLRYILWRSHDRLIHPDGQRNIFDKARDVQIKSRLRVGDYEPVASSMDYDSEERFSIRTKNPPKKTGIGYKVFVLKNGQLYPPMVANPGGEGTPVGIWLDADAAPIAGTSKTGRPQVRAGGKGTQGGSGQLAYRPGWHLGTIPYALQFNRKDSRGERTLFPNNFVWAEVEYADDVDYQEEARQEGVNANGKYQHSLAGLKHVPTDGSYKYRTNPDPRTDEWVITGAMRVNKILSREEVNDLVIKSGRKPQPMQDGDILTKEALDSLNAEIKSTREADEMGLLYRDDDSWSDDLAQRMYEQAVAESSLKWQEAWQDSMIGLKAIQDAIAKQTGNEAKGAENAYLFENRMHGRAKNMSEQYDWRFYKPMLKAFADFIKNREMTQEEGMDYLISKSGLERNVYYAMRDGFREKLTDEINDKREALEKEYSKGRISEDEYKEKKAELDEEERTGVDDRIKQFRGLLAYQRAKEDYQNGRIAYTEYLRRVESLLRSHLKRTKPKKDDEGNVISDNYYDDHAKDFSGLTETFAKELYDEAQTVKKEAQKTIDPQERRELWGKFNRLMQEAYITAREVAEDAVFAAESDGAAAEQQHTELWKKINDATKETLKQSYEMGLIDRDNYNKVREMFDYYIPLRGWEEDKASDVYTYMGRENVFSPAVKKTWGRTSQAENPLAYIGNIAVSTILSGHRNQMKQHFLNYVLNNPTSLVSISESWYENIGDQNGHAVWILRTADTAGKSADEIAQTVADFNEEMRLKQKEGKAMPVKGRLRLDVNATQGQKAEHVVEVQRAGRTYQLYINGNPKAAQALNGTHTKAVSRISDTYLGQHITALNRSMAAFFTSKNPAFVVSNLSRDLNMAGASVAIKEGADYNKRFIANVMKVLAPRIGESSSWIPASKQPTGMMPSLLRKWKKGTLDTNNDVERLFKEFMDEGGETGFVNMLSVDSFKEKMKKEIAQMNGCSLFGASVKAKETTAGKGLRLMGDTFEFYNRCAEDATRFIVYMTSRQMGKTLEESIADAKDVTLNFNRKGTGGLGNAEVRDLFIFVNPAIQALANMYKMAKGKPLKFGAVTSAFVAGGMLMPIINQWLLNLFGDDDDKNTYWNLPPWVRKNNFVMWIPGTKNFITVPLAQEFRVFYGIGEMVASGVMDHSVNNMGLEIVSSVADLVPINPTGNGGNLMVDFAPTGVQPLMQIGENVDFTGKPIWKENQGNKEAPMYTKAYISTPDWMVRVSSAVNSITGGNEGRKGFLEKYLPFWGNYVNNPAVWNHLMQGYFGGMYNTIAKTVDVGVTAARGEVPKVYQTPVINRFLNRPVERDNAGVLGEDYYSLTKERDEVMYELRTWRKKVTDLPADDPKHVEAQEHIDELTSSDRYKRAVTIGHYDRIIKDLKAGERAMKEGAPHKDKDLFDVHDQMDFYKQAMLDDLRAIDEGKDPIEAAMERYDQAKSFAEKDKLKKHIERMISEKASGNTTEGKSDVDKAKAYTEDLESESGKTSEIYLDHATSANIRDDARIKAAKTVIKAHTDQYRKLFEKGNFEEAEKYRRENRQYFDADMVIQTQSRLMERNKKLLGKGGEKADAAIMKIIDGSRQRMMSAIEKIK